MQVPSSTQRAIVAELRQSGCVFAEDEARLLVASSDTWDELQDRVARRVAGLPLEYVLGWAEFCGLRIAVESDVFIPRRRTEFLVHQALAVLGVGSIVVDLCCGSGAVGVALNTFGDRCQLHAVDVAPGAVRCARRNIGAKGQVYEGDLFDPLPRHLQGYVNVLVANAPYVPTAAIGMMPQDARLHEPGVALDGGADGLDIQRRIVADAPRWLAPCGHLLMETSQPQAEHAADLCLRHGLVPRIVTSDDLDAWVVVAQLA